MRRLPVVVVFATIAAAAVVVLLLADPTTDLTPTTGAPATQAPSSTVATGDPAIQPASSTVVSGNNEGSVATVQADVWRPMPSGPLSSREGAHMFWTGGEVFVIGGSDAPPCPPAASCVPPDSPALADGAAFDPATGQWRTIAPSPVPLGNADGVVHDGRIFLWVTDLDGRPASERAFLVYDPAEDSWERLEIPQSMPGAFALSDAGDLIVAHQTSQERGVDGDYLFDLNLRSWSLLPPDPLQPSFDRTMVWAGSELVLLGVEAVAQPGSTGPPVYRAAAYDMASGSWSQLPASEVIAWSPIWYWAGDRIINPSVGSSDGGDVNNYGRLYPFGGILDPASGSWASLPSGADQPTQFTGYTAGNPDLLLNFEGWVLDVAGGRWLALDAPDQRDSQGSAVTWAGSDLLVWGGVVWDGDNGILVNTGWMWRPDR